MKHFNAAMQGVFFVIGLIGFIVFCCETDKFCDWWRVLIIGSALLTVSFAGCVFFDDPSRYVGYIVGAIVVLFAAIYSFCHKLKQISKFFYDYKKRNRTYRNTYRKASEQYYRRKSTYNDVDAERIKRS